MKTNFKTSLIIATYNWPEALTLTLNSILLQKELPDEILIADDGSGEETLKVLENFKTKASVPVIHVWHEDKGFRLAEIRNRAILEATGDYIVQIDGDIVLGKYFIKDHNDAANPGRFVRGSRALISEKRTNKILESGKINLLKERMYVKNKFNSLRIPILSRLLRKESYRSNNIRGCNFAFWRNDFVKVNGYNNDMHGWGCEDWELAARLINIGIKQRKLKLGGVCYHLYHKESNKDRVGINHEIYQKVIDEKVLRCKNGIVLLD